MLLDIPLIDRSVVPGLRSFIVALSHLPVDVQIAALQDATNQVVEALSSVSK